MSYDYDLVVIGGGAAGLTASGIGASLGAKTLLVEKAELGGDCTWRGCVPSKTLLAAAKLVHAAKTAERLGLPSTRIDVDFAALMRHVDAVRRHVYDEADAPPKLEAFGVEVAEGKARFVDPHTVEIEGDGGARRVTFRAGIVATGSVAAVPDVPGLKDGPYLTNENVFDLTDQPAHLAIVGAGAIGTELAQAFTRLGTRVTVLDHSERILPRDDAELAAMLQKQLEGEGVAYRLNAKLARVEHGGSGVVLHLQDGEPVRADALLVAAGRKPVLEGFGLDAAGVAVNARGVVVNASGRTSQKHLYAVGDVAGGPAFTHWSEHTAKVAVLRALLKLPGKVDRARLPWVTYTDPELAHVGATEAELTERGESFETYRFPYSRIDRAITESATEGMIKVFATKFSGKILGASLLGAHAGELAAIYGVAMKNGIALRGIADTLFAYPTYALGARRAADQWYARQQTPGRVRLIQRVFGLRGRVLPFDRDRIV